MQSLLSAEDVAEILGVKPHAVRQLFREGRLSGCRVGKAWRIPRDVLDRDLELLSESLGTDLRVNSLPFVTVVEAPEPDPSKEPDLPRIVSDPPPSGSGSLLVFSEVPGLEVYLDGELKGPTTLSLTNISAGEHYIQIGEVADSIDVPADLQTKIFLRGDSIDRMSPTQTDAPADDLADTQPMTDHALIIVVNNRSTYSGELLLELSTETSDARLVSSDGAREECPRVFHFEIYPGQTRTVFDGTIRVHEGERLYLTLPEQPALRTATEQAIVLQSDLHANLTLTKGGIFGTKNVIRFRLTRTRQP